METLFVVDKTHNEYTKSYFGKGKPTPVVDKTHIEYKKTYFYIIFYLSGQTKPFSSVEREIV